MYTIDSIYFDLNKLQLKNFGPNKVHTYFGLIGILEDFLFDILHFKNECHSNSIIRSLLSQQMIGQFIAKVSLQSHIMQFSIESWTWLNDLLIHKTVKAT